MRFRTVYADIRRVSDIILTIATLQAGFRTLFILIYDYIRTETKVKRNDTLAFDDDDDNSTLHFCIKHVIIGFVWS